ncbi:MAG: O-antigen ligase family protein [Elusimicrobiota bacterium]
MKRYNFSEIIIFIVGILLFFIPLVPDEKITRWKLWVLETGLFSVLLLWLGYKILYSRIIFKISELNKPVFCWLVFIIFMYLISKNKNVAELELYRTVVSVSSFFLFSNVVSDIKGRKTIIICWLIGGFLSAIYGIITHYGGFWIIATPQVDRIFSTFGNPIFFAVFLVATIPLAIFKLIEEKEIAYKVIWFFMSISFVVALFFTKSRAGWIAFVVSILVYIFLSLDSKVKKLLLVSVLLIFAIVFVLKTRNVWVRQQGHLLIWRDSLRMLFNKPLLGVGLGAFHISFPKYASEQLKRIWPQHQNIVNDAHSEFVQILAELGLVGFGLFLWLIFSFLYSIKQFYKQPHIKEEILLFTALFSSAIAILVQNLFSVDMRFTISSFYIFSVFGLIASYSSIKTKELKLDFLSKSVVIIFFLVVIGFFESRMVIKQYRSWKIVFESKDFLDKRIINAEEQKNIIHKMLATNPADARLYFKLGYLWANEIKTNRESAKLAIENFTKAAQLDPAVEHGGAFNNLGNIYFTLGDRTKAKENYIKAISINPKLIDAHLNLGIAYYYEGKLNESAVEFETVLKLDPKNASAIYMLKKMRE